MAIKIKLGKKRDFDYPKSIKEVDEMTGEQFELFIFKYMKEYQGYEGELTEKNDYGVDIILWDKDNPTNRFGVQCKRYGPKTVLGENELMKMQKGVKHYGLFDFDTKKPNLYLFTSAEQHQLTGRGLAYIVNEDIQTYYREDIIEFIKDLDEKLNRDVMQSNYSNIAFETSKKKKGSFKENTKFVSMLKKERMNISKYNKISPVYLVYNDKTIEDIINKKPTTLEKLLEVRGFDQKKVDLFGEYLVNRVRVFMKLDPIKPQETEVAKVKQEEFTLFLKETRKKIASYNKIDKLYNVFNNKTLEQIVEKVPKTESELLTITGIGPAKTELWGKYLVGEIKKFLEKC
ncbi:MAG: Ribonuclease D [Candidatus Izimaplasma bacterium HR2]|nr:MAG: Ribonuclease D [Candidatus Izimaplasma bacterium HR2]